MDIVHDYRDVIEIGEKSSVIIWGAGNLGMELMCELNLAEFFDYYVSDMNHAVKEQVSNYIFPEDIFNKFKKQCISIILAVKSDNSVNDIIGNIESILQDTDCDVKIYRYIPENMDEMISRRKGRGFFNGHTYKKALGGSDAVNILINMIKGPKPFLFARWGAECKVVYRIRAGNHPALKDCMYLKSNLGVFPITDQLIETYCKIMENVSTEMDILCAFYWQKPLEKLIEWYSPNAVIVTSEVEYPFFSNPWTKALQGMKVLVIHPFAKLIEKQYKNRDKLFSNRDVLPEFELITYQAVQSLGGSDMYKNWTEALNEMQDEISELDFDIALIGCGAYGMPLGAFIKSKLHKKAIHMGGTLQILFGIKGKRWENEDYDYQHKLYNEYWVRPTDDLKPQNYKAVEDGCYW